MQIFYSPDITNGQCILQEEEYSHCIKVLRKKEGDAVHIMDGKGSLFLAEITDVSKKDCHLKIIETIQSESQKNNLIMAVAPTKNIDRFEWFLEKATEMGINTIIPIVSQNSERTVLKHERLEKVLLSAIKQSGNLYKPEIKELSSFKSFISLLQQKFKGEKYIAHCKEEYTRQELSALLKPEKEALILIGPEGDFTKEEIESALSNGFKSVSLGNTRLRTETAAIYACAAYKIVNNA